VILLAGAAGLVAGLFWAPVGVAATVGVVAYFTLAVAAHVRFRDQRNLPTPLAILLLAVAVLILRIV
jgi:DoxX-like family